MAQQMLTPEQLARLMGSLKTNERAKVLGVGGAANREEERTFRYIDSQNTAKVAEDKQVAASAAANRGLIKWPGAPATLEESGLAATGFEFDDSQKSALHTLTHGRHVCLIGAAGTGKTTMVKHALAKIIYGDEEAGIEPLGIRPLGGDQGPSIAFCAFTGIAVQVGSEMLPSWIRPATKTIHSLLEYKPSDQEGKMFEPTRHAQNKLDHDVIIIDEASMLGLDLWHNVVDALRPHTRIILIGDLNQLKPVADATMFAYALSAAMDGQHGWSIAELTTIHRQKEAAANKIIDAAHCILNGKTPVFDNPEKDPDWRFIGLELPTQGAQAHAVIAKYVDFFRKQLTPNETDSGRLLFDPYKDLLLCAGNGDDENNAASLVQQIPLNATLSRMIEPPTSEHQVYIIDAGRESRKFAVHHRVMATKNESPATKDRVTNGLTGKVTNIVPNPNWNGNKGMFGTESDVMEFRAARAKALLGNADPHNFDLANFDTASLQAAGENVERQASHVVTVKYNNGAERVYRSAADVGSIQLAYAITVHKAQGSQADTVIIICHHAVSAQLSREWLYTAVTRAKRRVILLYTRMGLSTGVNRQQIFGKDLREKVNRYRQVMKNGNVLVRLRAREVMTDLDNDYDGGDDE